MKEKEDADRVIERLHGFFLYGSRLTVKMENVQRSRRFFPEYSLKADRIRINVSRENGVERATGLVAVHCYLPSARRHILIQRQAGERHLVSHSPSPSLNRQSSFISRRRPLLPSICPPSYPHPTPGRFPVFVPTSRYACKMVRSKASSKKQQKKGIDFKKIKRKLGRKLPPPKNPTNTEIKSKGLLTGLVIDSGDGFTHVITHVSQTIFIIVLVKIEDKNIKVVKKEDCFQKNLRSIYLYFIAH
ncbi:hypothetical protein V6N11_000025 [Hibiscus sabdariffa]|uniref:Uncharacterized protein n=1 Tax=Hibiscus sabdariffa TaxID=183260 RepID=A0ABR1ZNJ0_9ROSI